MKLQLSLLITLFFLSCSNENNKANFLNGFSVFIEELELENTKGTEINWKNKQDSLQLFLAGKSNFRLTNKDEQDVAFFQKRFRELKGQNPGTKMNVNFYFENSASMNGYLSGKNFQQVMHRIYGNLNQLPINSYFVNTKEYAQEDILAKIDNQKIKVGDISNSDHQFIFTNAIENAIDNNLSIVITDGIYSVKDGNINVVSVDIENAFKRALSKNEIETVVLKLSSNFSGNYYPESCVPKSKCKCVPINQKRPYYVLLFGNSNSIDKALKDIAIIEELDGFENQARFFLTDNLKANYTILMQGEEKHGTFKSTKRGSDIITEIEDVKKFERSGFSGTPKNENYIQFGIAIDYSTINLPNSYKQDLNNYWADDNLGFTVKSIDNVVDIKKSTKTYKEIQSINDKNNTSFSHVITVKADTNLYGNLHIQLQNNLPAWIEQTATENDCEILNDESHTFAFDQLMIGISKAYQKVNGNNKYLDINLKTKV
jgi:hypothetical protein